MQGILDTMASLRGELDIAAAEAVELSAGPEAAVREGIMLHAEVEDEDRAEALLVAEGAIEELETQLDEDSKQLAETLLVSGQGDESHSSHSVHSAAPDASIAVHDAASAMGADMVLDELGRPNPAAATVPAMQAPDAEPAAVGDSAPASDAEQISHPSVPDVVAERLRLAEIAERLKSPDVMPTSNDLSFLSPAQPSAADGEPLVLPGVYLSSTKLAGPETQKVWTSALSKAKQLPKAMLLTYSDGSSVSLEYGKLAIVRFEETTTVAALFVGEDRRRTLFFPDGKAFALSQEDAKKLSTLIKTDDQKTGAAAAVLCGACHEPAFPASFSRAGGFVGHQACRNLFEQLHFQGLRSFEDNMMKDQYDELRAAGASKAISALHALRCVSPGRSKETLVDMSDRISLTNEELQEFATAELPATLMVKAMATDERLLIGACDIRGVTAPEWIDDMRVHRLAEECSGESFEALAHALLQASWKTGSVRVARAAQSARPIETEDPDEDEDLSEVAASAHSSRATISDMLKRIDQLSVQERCLADSIGAATRASESVPELKNLIEKLAAAFKDFSEDASVRLRHLEIEAGRKAPREPPTASGKAVDMTPSSSTGQWQGPAPFERDCDVKLRLAKFTRPEMLRSARREEVGQFLRTEPVSKANVEKVFKGTGILNKGLTGLDVVTTVTSTVIADLRFRHAFDALPAGYSLKEEVPTIDVYDAGYEVASLTKVRAEFSAAVGPKEAGFWTDQLLSKVLREVEVLGPIVTSSNVSANAWKEFLESLSVPREMVKVRTTPLTAQKGEDAAQSFHTAVSNKEGKSSSKGSGASTSVSVGTAVNSAKTAPSGSIANSEKSLAPLSASQKRQIRCLKRGPELVENWGRVPVSDAAKIKASFLVTNPKGPLAELHADSLLALIA